MKGVWLEDDGLAGGREEEGARNVPVAVASAPKITQFSLLLTASYIVFGLRFTPYFIKLDLSCWS